MNFRLYNTKTFITGILAEITTNTPIFDQAIDFANTARQIYNCTTPGAPVIIAAEEVLTDCMPPTVKYSIKYTILRLQFIVTVESCSNSITASLIASLLIGQAISIL